MTVRQRDSLRRLDNRTTNHLYAIIGRIDRAVAPSLARTAARRFVGPAALVILSLGLGFVLMEGIASGILAFGALVIHRDQIAAARYVDYDPELGWVSRPNVYIPDMYGKGVYLRTNSHGFRSNVEQRTKVPDGKVRIICSGDSFTFGYGVDNDHAWCQILSELDGRIESINMGQGGYGIDQAYLWYRRDGRRFNPSIHIFAFIDEDFRRMGSDRFFDYGKPTLAIRGSALQVENVPVPRRPFYVPSFQVREVIRSLKTYELLDKTRQRLRFDGQQGNASETDEKARTDRAKIEDLALRVFSELREMASSQQYKLVLVYLPLAEDCHGQRGKTASGDRWTSLRPRVKNLGVDVIDLTRDCQTLTAQQIDGLFIPVGRLNYIFSAGHYTEEGNRFVAEALYERLRAIVDSVDAGS